MNALDAARDAHQDARRALATAEIAYESATNHRRRAAEAVEHWQRHNDIGRSPRFLTAGTGGYHRSESGGLYQPDIGFEEPPSEERVSQLEDALADAQKAEAAAREKLEKVAEKPRKPDESTGWVALRRFKFAGTKYGIGDPVDIDVMTAVKLERLRESRFIRPVGKVG